MTIKETAIKFDIFIRDGGIGISMFFALILLIIVNTHSLHFLFLIFGNGAIYWIFSLLGALGFSFATISVIRKPVSKWMKWVYPLFDMIFVFLALNINNTSFPVHSSMIVLVSLFFGAILLGLGTINYNENYTEKNLESELILLNDTLNKLKGKYERLEYEKTSFQNRLTSFENIESENKSLKSKIFEIESKLTESDELIQTYKFQLTELETYRKGYLLAEAGRIRKKKFENRTDEEIELMNLIESE